jgi:hypothetical protein
MLTNFNANSSIRMHSSVRAEPKPRLKEMPVRATTRASRGSRLTEKLLASQLSLDATTAQRDEHPDGQGQGGLSTVVQQLAKV